MSEIECPVCGTPSPYEYCSQNCYLLGTKNAFACTECLKVLPVTISAEKDRKFCSHECKILFRHKAWKELLSKAKCGHCAAPLDILAASQTNRRTRLARNLPIYCNTTCSSLSNVRTESVEEDYTPCAVCGTLFKMDQTQRSKHKRGFRVVCSKNCVRVINSIAAKRKLIATPKETTCPHCKKTIPLDNAKIRSRYRKKGFAFCSSRCGALHQFGKLPL